MNSHLKKGEQPMKIEFDMEKPLSAKENWPGQYDLFSWGNMLQTSHSQFLLLLL